ncbi:MAG: hypothetical protein PHP37_03215 [Patescibacteria group bacterium]|nr:hypothetical protein [Patescibacteria group bacterium]
MKNSKLIRRGIINALGVFAYIFLLAVFMNKANTWFGQTDHDIITPVIVLLMFVFSALVTGGLVLGKPIMLYLDGKKKEGINLIWYTGLSIFILMFLAFLTLMLIK